MRLTAEHVPLQGELDRLVLQVPQEKLLRVTFQTRVCLEIRGLLAPTVQEVWDSQAKGGGAAFLRHLPALLGWRSGEDGQVEAR